MPAKRIERLARALCAVTDGGKPAKVVDLARAWGIDGRLARRAARGIPVNASAYLQLCAAACIDPVTGEAVIVAGPIFPLDPNRLAIRTIMAALREKRTVRALAKKWGISTGAIERAKTGKPLSIDTFLRLCAALSIHPHDVLRAADEVGAGRGDDHIERLRIKAGADKRERTERRHKRRLLMQAAYEAVSELNLIDDLEPLS